MLMKLPKEKKAIAQLINAHVHRHDQEYRQKRLMWRLAQAYLAGARRFQLYDVSSGQLKMDWTDEEGNIEYASQKLIGDINEVMGRLLEFDMRPSVLSTSSTLFGIRNRAVTQIMVDAGISADMLEQKQEEFVSNFVRLGFCAVRMAADVHPALGLTSKTEIIHPRDIFPFPQSGEDYTKVHGYILQKVVPIEWVREKYPGKITKKTKHMAAVAKVDPTDDWEDQMRTSDTGINFDFAGSLLDSDSGTMEVVRIYETFVLNEYNLVDRYIVSSGDIVLYDSEDDGGFGEVAVYNPVGIARFFDNGTFYGMGMFELLYGIHRHFEIMTKDLFNNIADIDRYGFIFYQGGTINLEDGVQQVAKGLNAVQINDDGMAQERGFTPQVVQPFTAGDLPGKTAAFAQQIMDALNPIRDIIKEKGRIDSGIGMQLLDEAANRGFTKPTTAFRRAFSTAYRAFAQTVSEQILFTGVPVPVTNLTMDLAGAVIDPEKNELLISQNVIPDLRALTFTVKTSGPQSKVARKMEAIDLYKGGMYTDPMTGMPDLTSFKLFLLKDGIDVAMWMEEEAAAYEVTIRHLLTLYGDGETPGQIVMTPETVKPEVALRLVNIFLSRPAMQVASPEVHNELYKYRDQLMMYMGSVLPPGVPTIEEMALPQEQMNG